MCARTTREGKCLKGIKMDKCDHIIGKPEHKPECKPEHKPECKRECDCNCDCK